MSCGRPAYVYDAYGSDGWMTADSYADLEADSIAGQAYPGIVDAARLRADLARYDPTMGHVNRTLVLKHHQARTHAQELVQLFGEVAPAAAPRVTEARELARLVRLRWRAEGELHVVRAAFHAVEQRTEETREEVERVTRRLEESERHRADVEAALAEERELRHAAQRRRRRTLAQRRALRRRLDALLGRRWVRLGMALRLVPAPSSSRASR